MDANNHSTKQEPAHNNKDTNPKFSKEYQELHIRPWTRFFARYIDIYVFGLIVGMASALFYPSLLNTNNIANGLIILFLWFIFEPIVLCSCGTTLGKFLLNNKTNRFKR